MKLKIITASLIIVLIIICMLQIFPVPPYAENIYPYFKSDYFAEIDRTNSVIVSSFIRVKMYAPAAHAWILMEDFSQSEGITVEIFDRNARLIRAPGFPGETRDAEVSGMLNKKGPWISGELKNGRYVSFHGISAEKECLFCHKSAPGDLIGIIKFKNPVKALYFYSMERSLYFSSAAFFLLLLLVFVCRWTPGKRLKEMFDK